MGLKGWLIKRFIAWLNHEKSPGSVAPCDFERLSFEIRPCDVLLVEGRTRIANIIKAVTISHWTHSALYIGRLRDIDDEAIQARILRFYEFDLDEQLVIEPLLGQGTVINPLSKYRNDHLRICRPKGLERSDAQRVIATAVDHLGMQYDMRQLIDLARYILPFGILPKRWRSTLFEYHPGTHSRTVCSTMIADAFAAVHYPVRPVIRRRSDGQLSFHKRNTRLYTPSDFDYSPYFQIVKYPILGFDDVAVYRQLPWDAEGLICNSEDECFLPAPAATKAQANKHDESREGMLT